MHAYITQTLHRVTHVFTFLTQLQLLAADGSNIVYGSPSASSLKLGSNGTLATNEGLSPGQLSDAQEVLMPLVYMFFIIVVCFRCKALYSGDSWFYNRKDVKEKMENQCAWSCTSQPDSSAREVLELQRMGNEDESNNDEGTSLLPETHTSIENVRDNALMRNMSMILAFQLLATLLSLCLGREMTIHYLEVYHSVFAKPFATVSLCLWGVALLVLAIGVLYICYTCIRQCCAGYRHLNLCGTYCCLPISYILTCCCCDHEVMLCLACLLSSIVDIVLTIGTIHFLAYITSVSLPFLLAAFLRNWLLTFYIAVTNVSCFIILLLALAEVIYFFLKLKLDKPAPGPKAVKCLMAVLHRAAVILLFIILSLAVCIIYLHPHVLYNHLSASPMFTPVVAMAATIIVIYTIIRRYHIFPFNKDAKEYITKEKV